MSVWIRSTTIALVLVWFAAWAPVWADAPDSSAVPLAVALGPGSVLWLEGTSTVHDFEARSTEVAVALERDRHATPPGDAGGLLALIRTSGVRNVVVQVPVASLRSGKAALDKNLRRSMRADEYPNVRFHLTQYALAPRPAPDDTIAIRAEGSLAIAGHERSVDLEARAYRANEGVWLEGSETLRMSDYGIKPPTMMLGTLRVGDRINVRYRLLLVPKGEGADSSTHHSR